MNFLINIFTSRDNVTYSMSKLAAIIGVAALTINFVKVDSIDFQGYGLALGGLIVALAAKSLADK